jgi:hypothetical protein
MTRRLLNDGNVDSGRAPLRVFCTVASCASIRSTEPMGRCGSAGAHHA